MPIWSHGRPAVRRRYSSQIGAMLSKSKPSYAIVCATRLKIHQSGLTSTWSLNLLKAARDTAFAVGHSARFFHLLGGRQQHIGKARRLRLKTVLNDHKLGLFHGSLDHIKIGQTGKRIAAHDPDGLDTSAL